LVEFCYHRLRAERREQEWRNKDRYYQGDSPVVAPRRWDRRDRWTRRVGEGGGDRFSHGAPGGGHFAGRAPGREEYDFGPPSRGFERFDRPRFPRCGDWQLQAPRDRGQGMFDYDFANPSFEQMAWLDYLVQLTGLSGSTDWTIRFNQTVRLVQPDYLVELGCFAVLLCFS